ncbi:MAG: phospholipid carrier-dependent glycosyltransferase [Chloroflexi bacterium]|nr:phospholipid carrier-dependent glycosyltransferase [Chloroflexota bacterium]
MTAILVVIILIVAAALRLTGIDWDGYQHYHPDERYITWVATTIERPSSLKTALNPHQSPFNPYYWPPDAASEGIEVLQDTPRKFAYGHLPLYLGVLGTRLLERLGPLAKLLPQEWLLTRDLLNAGELVEFRHLTAVSRALTALFDTGTVLLVFFLGKRLFGTAVGLLAAAFLAVNVMHIQLSHFFISDPYLTFFVTAALLFMVAAYQNRGETARGDDVLSAEGHNAPSRPYTSSLIFILAAIFTGLAIGSKFSAVLLLLPLGLTAWLCFGEKWMKWLGTAVLVIFLTFFLTNPFAVLDFSCDVVTPATQIGPVTIPSVNWGSCYLDNIATQNGMVRGATDNAFTRQYAGTPPYLYFVEMQLRWGMGWLLGLTAFAGLIWVMLWVIKRLKIRDWRLWPEISSLQSFDSAQDGSPISNLLILAWVIPYFVVTGGFYVKFMRYMMPITPFLMIFAAALLLSIKQVWWKRAAVTAVLLTTSLYALAFVNMYSQPHPWNAASEWIYRQVRPGALILSEQWDDSLPSSMLVDGRARYRSEYPNAELTWLTGPDDLDNETKLAKNLALLAEADYLTLSSNRIYGVVPRLPQRYPLSSQYHQLLLDGKLGYEPVLVVDRAPNLAGVYWRADTFGWPGLRPSPAITDYLDQFNNINGGRADESFIVYDQPLTIVFENVAGLTAEEMTVLFATD